MKANRAISIVLLIGLCLTVAGFVGSIFVNAQSPTTYFYVITASDSSGNESPFSNEAKCSPISAPKPHCDLSWTASTSTVAGYNVYRSTVTGGPYTKVNPSLVTTLTYSDLPVNFPNPPTGLAAAPGTN